MKVLIVAGWYPSKFSLANGDFIMYQTRALVKSGIEAAVIYAHLDVRLINRPKDILHQYSFSVDEGVPTFMLSGFFLPKINSLFLQWWTQRFATLFQKYKEKYGMPDLLHAQTFLGGLVAMQLSKKYGIPYLITEHQTAIITDDIPKWKLPHMRKVYDNASIAIAISHELKKKMESSFTSNQVSVVPEFIDTDKFNFPSQHHSGFNFIAIGDLIPRKGFDVLIQAYKLFVEEGFKHTSLIIIGDGKEKDNLADLAGSLQIENQVQFPGRCSQEEVAAFLKQSDVFVMSSKVETFGIVVIEAMASGLPVISTRCYGPLDIVNESNGILIPVDDIEEMKKAMVYMYNNKKLYDKNEIRKHVVENFSNEAVIKKLRLMYESLI